MARILSLVVPDADERAAVDAVLGPDVAWAADGLDALDLAAIEGALTFWPRRELAAAGLSWNDLPGLRLIQTATAGVNHVGWGDIPPHVAVASAPGSSAPMVAEHVLAFILWWTRGLGAQDRAIRAGRVEMGAPVRALSSLRVGLVGHGGVGRAVAELLGGFGCTVHAVTRSGPDRSGKPSTAHIVGTLEDLGDLAAWSDVLVLCVPLVQGTVGLVDAAVLERMEGSRLLVNVARGHIVDEDALFDWLAADPGHCAALDVWWRYPSGEVAAVGGPAPDGPAWYPYTRPFHDLPNVVMTPHDAPNVDGFRARMLEQAAGQLRHWLDGGEPVSLQDREAHQLGLEGDGR